MANFASTLKSRSSLQAGANTETVVGRVTRIYPGEAGATVAADVRIQGQPYPTERVGNASTAVLWVGADVKLNWKRGTRFKPEIIGVAGSTAGTVLSSAAAASTGAAFGNSSDIPDLTGIPMLLATGDPDAAPDGLVANPGANVLLEATAGEETSGGAQNGRLTISAKPLVLATLPNPASTSLPDGTVCDLQSSYGQSLGMYRLDKMAGQWRRRDIGSGTGATSTIVDSLPPADISLRGQFYTLNAAGVADETYLCRRAADGTYFWHCITSGVDGGIIP